MTVVLRFLCAALVFWTSCCTAIPLCIHSFTPLDKTILGITSDPGLTWPEVQERCSKEHPGYWMLMRYEYFAGEEIALCPAESLVPIGIFKEGADIKWNNLGKIDKNVLMQSELHKFKDPDLNGSGIWGALRWPYGGLILVGPETKFRCFVCQISDRDDVISEPVYPLHNNSDFAYDLELVSFHQIDDISLVANGSDLTNKLLDDLAEAFNISVKSLRWHGAILNKDRKAVVHVYYDRGDINMDWFYYVHWNDEYVDHATVEKFDITLIKPNSECTINQTSLQNIKKDNIALTGTIDYTFNTTSGIITSRECYWDNHPQFEVARWSPFVSWVVNWKECDYKYLKEAFPQGEESLAKSIKNIDLSMVFVLRKLLDDPVENVSLMTAIDGIKLFLQLHSLKTVGTAFAILSLSILPNMAIVFARSALSNGKSTELIRSQYVNVIVADLEASDPIVGLEISLPSDQNKNKLLVTQIKHAELNATQVTSHIVITVSNSIAYSAKRLAIATYAAHLDLPNSDKIYDISIDCWISLVQVTFTRNGSYEVMDDDDYIDIAFNATFHNSTLQGKCAERVFASNEWYGGNCVILKSKRNQLTVCRCKNLFKEHNITNGVYLIYGFDASFCYYLANHMNLVIVMVFVCILSALGLLSVILTAFFFRKWRENQGHQIFLQMIFSLAVNLILGFFNSFVNIDTKSVACIAVGVLRHYSFLAMFFWMMILSALQIKRLTTISGSKSTTHLILKVSLVAWGLPLLPIVVLLSWDTGFYKSEISDRGYCYPEGIAFQVTVQGPAAVILIGNMFIFLIILNHIYGWFECGKKMEVRKHTNDRAEQLRRLATSIFIFFLFGFTWLFHFLSEEGIINSEFLFEFMFLITASFHVFMLSLFFIVLDKNTRDLWIGLKKSIKVPWRRKEVFVRKTAKLNKERKNRKHFEGKARRVRPGRPRNAKRCRGPLTIIATPCDHIAESPV